MKKSLIYLIKLSLASVLVFNILALIWVLVYGIIPIPSTKLMLIESEKATIRYEWRTLDQISDHLELAVMCAEDQFFLTHYGLDFESISRAEQQNQHRKSKRGASTLTQQVAKNVFLWPSRTYVRKAAELYFALLIEVVWSKERIMEVYLNVAELGKGVFGAEAASQYYFKKPASKLSPYQAASLAAVLPSPKQYSPVSPSAYVQSRIRWINTQMKQWGGEMTYNKTIIEQMNK